MRIYNRNNEMEKRRKLRKDMTKAETILWTKLKNKQLNDTRFRRQYSVGPYIVDFYCPKPRLVIELDGSSHFEDGTKEYDEERQKDIEACGISFLRFTNTDVYENLYEVLQKIHSAVVSPSCEDYK